MKTIHKLQNINAVVFLTSIVVAGVIRTGLLFYYLVYGESLPFLFDVILMTVFVFLAIAVLSLVWFLILWMIEAKRR